jgi:CelD/BcsL family acetyltransferase involved in cellulose biosynthesis
MGEAMQPTKAAPFGLTTEILRDDGDFEALEHEWRALHERSGARSPFTTWTWMFGWWMEIGRPAGYELRIHAVRAADRLVGVGAFYVEEERFNTRVLHNLGDTLVGSEYLDVLCDPEHAEAAVDAIASMIASADDLDAGKLVDLDEGSRFVAALRRGHPGLLGLECAIDERLPYVELRGSIEAFSASLSSNMRYNLKRKEKKLQKEYPAARVTIVDRPDEIADNLELLFRLHARRWESKGQTGNFVRPDVRAFHRRVAPKLLETGRLRLYRLDLDDGKVAAMLYCLRTGNREFYLQAGMDPSFEGVSAGFCLMKRVIEGCAKDGLLEFDMLRGTEGYKSHWASKEHVTHSVRFARRTAKGALWASQLSLFASLKDIAERRLPGDILQAIRQRTL